MPMEHATNQEELGKNLFFFRSLHTGGSDHCLLLGHGGWKESDGKFKVPVGRTLNFYRPHDTGLLVDQEWLILGPAVAAVPQKNLAIPGPDESFNYVLAKSLGTTGAEEGKPVTYLQIGATMDKVKGNDWAPHVVTVRNLLKMHGVVPISTIIDAVIGHAANVRHFYYGACRTGRS